MNTSLLSFLRSLSIPDHDPRASPHYRKAGFISNDILQCSITISRLLYYNAVLLFEDWTRTIDFSKLKYTLSFDNRDAKGGCGKHVRQVFHSAPFLEALLPVVLESFMSHQKYVTFSRDSIQGISELRTHDQRVFLRCIIV